MMPICMPPNVFPHFYRGGGRLAALRGFAPASEFEPEDWLAATVHRAGAPDIGPSRLADGTLFADVVAADPAGWLGDPTGGPNGPADTGILVKLLDAEQRLPVHVHPDRSFAGRHLHSCYGKTESWFVLAAEGTSPSFWLGFADDVDPAELAAATEAQDSEWMLSRMNRIPAVPGMGLLVPAGTAHAIGAGVFVIEAQEPTDLSILLEWSITTCAREDAHLDLGFAVALTAVDHRRLSPQALRGLIRNADPNWVGGDPLRLLPAAADDFFTVQLLAPPMGATVAATPGFAVAIVTDGDGTLRGDAGELAVSRGQVLAVPAAFGPWSVTGAARIVQCLPGRRSRQGPQPEPAPATRR